MYQPWENEELPTPKEGDPAAAVVDVEPKGEDDWVAQPVSPEPVSRKSRKK